MSDSPLSVDDFLDKYRWGHEGTRNRAEMKADLEEMMKAVYKEGVAEGATAGLTAKSYEETFHVNQTSRA